LRSDTGVPTVALGPIVADLMTGGMAMVGFPLRVYFAACLCYASVAVVGPALGSAPFPTSLAAGGKGWLLPINTTMTVRAQPARDELRLGKGRLRC
jgi:hypothetical protein